MGKSTCNISSGGAAFQVIIITLVNKLTLKRRCKKSSGDAIYIPHISQMGKLRHRLSPQLRPRGSLRP